MVLVVGEDSVAVGEAGAEVLELILSEVVVATGEGVAASEDIKWQQFGRKVCVRPFRATLLWCHFRAFTKKGGLGILKDQD